MKSCVAQINCQRQFRTTKFDLVIQVWCYISHLRKLKELLNRARITLNSIDKNSNEPNQYIKMCRQDQLYVNHFSEDVQIWQIRQGLLWWRKGFIDLFIPIYGYWRLNMSQNVKGLVFCFLTAIYGKHAP